MKNFSVYYRTNVESVMVAEFDTLADAVAYCDEETKGCELVADGDNRYENHNISFSYEVFEGNPLELDEDGDVTGLKNPTYETELYYGKD